MWQKKIYLSFADTSAEKDVHTGVHFKAWIDLFCGSITNQHHSQAVILFSDFSAFDVFLFFFLFFFQCIALVVMAVKENFQNFASAKIFM